MIRATERRFPILNGEKSRQGISRSSLYSSQLQIFTQQFIAIIELRLTQIG